MIDFKFIGVNETLTFEFKSNVQVLLHNHEQQLIWHR